MSELSNECRYNAKEKLKSYLSKDAGRVDARCIPLARLAPNSRKRLPAMRARLRSIAPIANQERAAVG